MSLQTWLKQAMRYETIVLVVLSKACLRFLGNPWRHSGGLCSNCHFRKKKLMLRDVTENSKHSPETKLGVGPSMSQMHLFWLVRLHLYHSLSALFLSCLLPHTSSSCSSAFMQGGALFHFLFSGPWHSCSFDFFPCSWGNVISNVFLFLNLFHLLILLSFYIVF